MSDEISVSMAIETLTETAIRHGRVLDDTLERVEQLQTRLDHRINELGTAMALLWREVGTTRSEVKHLANGTEP